MKFLPPLLFGVSISLASEPEEDFIRFTENASSGKLETAVVRFQNKDDVAVDLIGVVHIGDKTYYEALNKSFVGYDALLYEMVGGTSKGPMTKEQMKGQGKSNPLRFFQVLMQKMLELEFQLDQIDYSARNFVHADMDWATFNKLSKDKGENIFKMLEKSFEHQEKLAEEGVEKRFDFAALASILYSDKSADEIKLVLGRQFEEVEAMITGMGSDDSVILGERNKVALGVLQKEIAKGKKRIGVFFGAGHLQGMAKILVGTMGFTRKKTDWIAAWDVPKTKPSEGVPEAEASPSQEEKAEPVLE